MNNYKPYPSYRPSNVEWLGDLPSHWDLRRLKFIASVTYSNVDKHSKEGEIPVRLCNYVDVYKNDHITNTLEFMEATADSGEIKKFGLQKGDVIVTKDSEEWKDIAVPAFVPESLDGVICGYHLALIRPYLNQVDGEYLFRAFRAPAINYQFQVAASGITRYGLSKQALGDAWILLPPIEEQRAISAYLNRETVHIDALITKKRELIDLLDKKRTSIISHAVTKGLNPKARMKSSGVEWLGDVPEHWEVWKIGHIFRQIGSGTTPPTSNQEYYDGTIPWVTTSELRDNTIVTTQKKVTEDAVREFSALKKYPSGTLLIALYGATIGRIGLLGIEATTNQACSALVNPKNMLAKFAFYSLLACRQWLIGLAYGGGQPNISQSIVKNLKLSVPPKDEQKSIVEYLENELNHLDSLKKQVEDTISLLEKQRIALISAAVTGKIDVREQGN